MIEVAGVIVRKGKAYIPVHAKSEGGPYYLIEPVFTVDLTVDDLLAALSNAIAAGHPQIPPPTKEDMKKCQDPILRASGTKSWKQLAKNGASYNIFWSENQTILYMSRLDNQGRFEPDPNKTKTFPKDTEMRVIVEAILADANTRPELELPAPVAVE